MQVIPDNLNITTGQHVFETPEDIVINSQIYDKITMEPKPYNFFNMNTVLTNKNLLLHNVNILEYTGVNMAKENNYKYYIQDSQNPDLYYCLSEIGPSNTNQYFHQIKKVENGWQVVKSISPDSGYRWNYNTDFTYLHYKMLGQTDNYVILAQIMKNAPMPNGNGEVGWGASGWGNTSVTVGDLTFNNHGIMNKNFLCANQFAYIAINKNNLSVKTLNVSTQQNIGVFLIKEFSNFIYIYENLAGRVRIVRYEPETNTRTQFYAFDTYCDTKSMGLSNIILFNDKYYTLVGNASGYKFLQITIDFDYNKITGKIIDMPNTFSLHNATNRSDGLDSCWLFYDLKNIKEQYISVSAHDQTNAIRYYQHQQKWYYYASFTNVATSLPTLAWNSLSSLGWHRFGLFKYNKISDTFESKGLITPDETNQHIYGLIYYDEYTPIFLTNKRIVGYRLNLETEKYEKCFEKAGTFYTIGLDENNKFYTFDNANNCNIYNDVTSFELNADFERPNYTYNNTDIDTYVTIYSKNFVNNYIKTKVEVTLDGSCKFTSNGKKKLITYTDPNGKLNIPVTVYYGGTVYCYIKEVE